MRSILLISFILAFMDSIAQDYLTNDPRWHVRSICAVPAPCIATDQKFYSTAGDTMIQNVIWTKVIQQGSISYSWQASPPVFNCSGTVFYGPIPETTNLVRQQGRQLRILSFDQDILLFDFDLSVGDTLPLSYTNWNTDITVIAVDSVLIGNTMRARYELGNSWAQFIVEGMGSSNGLFEPIGSIFECGHDLICYGLGSEAFYPQSGPACDFAMGVEEFVAGAIRLSPVPVSDVLKLESVLPLGTIRVIDANGRNVRQLSLNSTTAQLDISDLRNGIYAIVQENESAIRFIVSH